MVSSLPRAARELHPLLSYGFQVRKLYAVSDHFLISKHLEAQKNPELNSGFFDGKKCGGSGYSIFLLIQRKTDCFRGFFPDLIGVSQLPPRFFPTTIF